MSGRKIIAIAGATGAQGGGLARAILGDPESEFSVRALTRDPSSDKARALADAGAEVVKADLHDVESVKRAFAGAYGAYCVTFFWAHFSPDTEFAEAKSMAGAAEHAGLKHVIWSTLEDTRKSLPLDDPRTPVLLERYTVPHFDVKAEADELFRASGVPTTFAMASFYWENFIAFGQGPRAGDDGSLVLSMPMGDAKLAGIASEDIGKCAYGIFKRGTELAGRTIGLAGDQLTGNEMAEKFSRALGRPVKYQPMSFDAYRSLGFPGAEEMGNMYQFYAEFEAAVGGARDVGFSRELNPELQDFDAWLADNADKIPV
ncbi:MAG: NmrA/HSCARG family protein [Gemmatimonadaceae bacterium]